MEECFVSICDLKLPPAETIAAIVPVYTERGDETLILTCDGKTYCYGIKIQSLIKRLARKVCVDIRGLQQAAFRLLSQSSVLPLRFSEELLLVPLRMRIPRTTGDRGSGYVNYFAFQELADDGANCILAINDGHLLTVLWSKKTTFIHLNNGRILAQSFRKNEPLLRLLRPLFNIYWGYDMALEK